MPVPQSALAAGSTLVPTVLFRKQPHLSPLTCVSRRGSCWVRPLGNLLGSQRSKGLPQGTSARHHQTAESTSNPASTPNSAPSMKRVLSIQSHVVHGYVGNRCAVFPLQLLGYDVDFINSVQFSNHTGYPGWKGTVMDGEQLWDIVEGLKANGLLEYSHLVTGYIGSVSFLETVKRLLQLLRQHNPDLIYVCDPVMGDHGRLYVKPELPGCYKDEIVPLASVMTPNQFELELLVGHKVATEEDAVNACQSLHAGGPSTVVITSFHPEGVTDHLYVIASTTLEQDDGLPQRLRIRIARSDAYFTGTGDLMTALLLAWLDKYPRSLKTALEKAVAGLQAVLQATVESAGQSAFAADRNAKVAKDRELRLIQNQHLLQDPDIKLLAEPLT